MTGSINVGSGAVSCNHSRTTMSSMRSGEAFRIDWANVDVGVYGFSAKSSPGEEDGGASVFRALQECYFTRKVNSSFTYGIMACSSPQVFCSSLRTSMSALSFSSPLSSNACKL